MGASVDDPDAELIALIIDDSRAGSIKSNINFLLNCSDEVQEMLSADTRKIVNDLRDEMFRLEALFEQGMPTAPQETLDDIVTSLLALSGLNHESMMRGIDWRFQAIGRRVERAIQTATLLQSTLTVGLEGYRAAACFGICFTQRRGAYFVPSTLPNPLRCFLWFRPADA